MKEKKKNVLHLVWKHWRSVYLKNKWYLLGINIFYLLALSLDALFRPIQYKNIFDLLSSGSFEWTPVFYIGFSLCLMWLFNRIGDFLTVFTESKTIKEFQDYAMTNLLKKDTSFYSDTTSGGLVAKAKRFARISEVIIDEFVFSINKSLVLILGIVIYLGFMIPELFWIFFFWIAIFMIATVYLSSWREKSDLLSSEADSITTSKMSDIFLSITTLRVFSAVHRTRDNFLKTIQDEEDKRRKAWYIGNIQWAIQALLIVVLEITCMYILIQSVIKGVHTVGTLVLVQAYIASLASYMWGFGRSIIKTRTAFAEAYEMAILLEKPDNETFSDGYIKNNLLDNSIEFLNVSFGYSKERGIVSNLNLKLNQGFSYGLVGKTGSGKSTITRLILRLYEANDGLILIGGKSIQKIDQAIVRSWISYVPQEPQFPSWSIRDLISMGKPNATQQEIQESAEKACCDFIWERFPDGYNTLVGERGVKLSGGERQRIAIAAAILKNAPIVIMDEPTSSLDAKTEQSIQNAIEKHFRGKTLIVIAHRLSTVASLDEIILLSEGEIKAKGNHEKLLDISDAYKEMWELQTRKNHFSLN